MLQHADHPCDQFGGGILFEKDPVLGDDPHSGDCCLAPLQFDRTLTVLGAAEEGVERPVPLGPARSHLETHMLQQECSGLARSGERYGQDS